MSGKSNNVNFNKMNIGDFIDYIVTFDNIDDILNTCNSQSEKGFIFERIFDIVIKFGFCDIFPNSQFDHLCGNVNTGKLTKLEDLNLYLNNKVKSSNSSGCSDITLYNKLDKTYVFISCKYLSDGENDVKSIEYYDIQNIIAMISKNKYIYKQSKIYLLVPNKKNILKKVRNSNKSSNYITDYMLDENIFDKADLNKYFMLFKNDIIKYDYSIWNEVYLSSKDKLFLRFHQELIVSKTSDLIEKGNKTFLWGCKCRSGKTYMVGGIIVQQFENKKLNKLPFNALIITPAPTETTPQFTQDLFNKFRDFNEFKIHNIENSKMFNVIELDYNNIFVISKQLLQRYINDTTNMMLKNLNLDIIAFDEVHHSGCTDLSKDIITSYSSKNTVKYI